MDKNSLGDVRMGSGFQIIDEAGKMDQSLLDDAVKRYGAGLRVPAISLQTGIPTHAIYKALKRAGIRGASRRIDLPVEEIVRLYHAGTAEFAIAKKFGVSRRAIELRLAEGGVIRRTPSEANFISAERLSPEFRKARAMAANRIARVRKHTVEEQNVRAKTVMDRGLHIDQSERDFAAMLAERGVQCVHQEAVGPYNCDLGIFPVAVEIFGGNWHWHGRHLMRSSKRFRYILNAGWHVIVVKVERRRHPLNALCADYVIAFLKEASANPAMRRQYRVIRGAAELMSSGSVDDDKIAIIPTLRSRQHILRDD